MKSLFGSLFTLFLLSCACCVYQYYQLQTNARHIAYLESELKAGESRHHAALREAVDQCRARQQEMCELKVSKALSDAYTKANIAFNQELEVLLRRARQEWEVEALVAAEQNKQECQKSIELLKQRVQSLIAHSEKKMEALPPCGCEADVGSLSPVNKAAIPPEKIQWQKNGAILGAILLSPFFVGFALRLFHRRRGWSRP
ncbi:MAG: hypothetical protein J5I94_12020 [Phaeodactylibacter sp.]|nr:hypothetical protein [Phaeodactylibacter sp.]